MSARPSRLCVLLATAAVLTGCSGHADTTPSPSGQQASASASPSAAGSVVATPPASAVPESQVDLPAPPAPTVPAASTAGALNQGSLPLPVGWRAVAAPGGVDQGYLGNGTPAHARDPRYAAYEVMAVGCAPLRRDAWTDPTHALEVDLARGGSRGVADVMEFATPQQAQRWFGLWLGQVAACHTGSDPRTQGSGSATTWIGTRHYGDGSVFRETAAVRGSTVRLYALPDRPRAQTPAEQRALLEQIREPG